MKILVFSDTHGDIGAMRDVILKNMYDTDVVIHLGDNLRDLHNVMSDFPFIASLGVLGNCDFAIMNQGARFEGCFTACKRRIFYTHGHKFNVKAGYECLVSNAKFNKADVVLYGHSHIALYEEKNGIAIINPGSISCPRDGSKGTYAMLEIEENNLICKILEI